MENRKIDLKRYIDGKGYISSRFVRSVKDLAKESQSLDEGKNKKSSIFMVSIDELRKMLIESKIPLKRMYRDYYPPYFEEKPERPYIFGFYKYLEKTGESFEICIFQQGIYLDAFGESICWVWPEKYKERINLLKRIKKLMQEHKIYFEETYISKIEEKLYSLGILNSFENDSYLDCEEDLTEITKHELEKIKLVWPFPIKIRWLGERYCWSNYYFKRGFPFQSKWFESMLGYKYNVHEINVTLLKYENKPAIFELYISENSEKEELAESYFTQDFQHILTLLKIVDSQLIGLGYFRVDNFIENESLKYLDPVKSELMLKVANDYFLQFETFSFDEETALEHISNKPTFRGTNWKQYSEQYRLWKKGKSQDDIAIQYRTSQQTISNHINKVEGELSRIRGEAYEKWLKDRYEIEAGVKKVERDGSTGQPDLVVFKENNYVEVINAKAYNFKPSRTHLTINAKEYQPEIEKARELEKKGYFVRVYVDFFNLYNNKRYPRKLIDHKQPPERITIMYTDAE